MAASHLDSQKHVEPRSPRRERGFLSAGYELASALVGRPVRQAVATGAGLLWRAGAGAANYIPEPMQSWLRRGARRLRAAQRRRRLITGLAGAAVLVLCSAVLSGLLLARAAPVWWVPVDTNDPAVRRLAEKVENQVVSAGHKFRGAVRANADGTTATGDDWSFVLSVAEANAWLNVRLPRWLSNREDAVKWPAELTQMQVMFDGQRVRVGVMATRGEGTPQVLAAVLEPRLRDGALWLTAERFSVGRLPIPAGWVLAGVREHRDMVPSGVREMPETDLLLAALAGERPVLQEAVVRLGDGRRVRLLGIEAAGGKLEVRCRTEVMARGDR